MFLSNLPEPGYSASRWKRRGNPLIGFPISCMVYWQACVGKNMNQFSLLLEYLLIRLTFPQDRFYKQNSAQPLPFSAPAVNCPENILCLADVS